jgi:hypothetical protein
VSETTGRRGLGGVLRPAAQFLVLAVPVWLASHFLWAYDGGLNLWSLKNEIELTSVVLVAAAYTFWQMLSRFPPSRKIMAVPIFLASAAFLLGGYKAANDYLDPPDLLLGILAQLVGFIYLFQIIPRRPKAPGPGPEPPSLGPR